MKSDLELMAALRRGDRSAFYRLVRRHQVAMYNFFHALCNDPSRARELTARVFLHLFTERSALNQNFKFSMYLYRAGYACWMDHQQRHGSKPLALPFPPGPVGSDNGTDPAHRAAVPIKHDAEGLLGCLSNELRLLVVLKEVNGLTYSEISAVLEISEEVVRRSMNEAFRYLRSGYAAPPSAAGSSGSRMNGPAAPQA